jgi:hypothetical protein
MKMKGGSNAGKWEKSMWRCGSTWGKEERDSENDFRDVTQGHMEHSLNPRPRPWGW